MGRYELIYRPAAGRGQVGVGGGGGRKWRNNSETECGQLFSDERGSKFDAILELHGQPQRPLQEDERSCRAF